MGKVLTTAAWDKRGGDEKEVIIVVITFVLLYGS